MRESSSSPGARLLAWWMVLVCRFPVAVGLIFVATTGLSLHYAVANFQINTNRNEMVSSELPFRRQYDAFLREFPQFIDTMVLVVDGDTPELAEEMSQGLAERLRRRPDLFLSVFLPQSDSFFDRNGLLYLDLDELEDLADRLARIQPFLGRLTHDRSLTGLFSMLELALERQAEGHQVDLDPLLAAVAETTQAALRGERSELSWEELMQGVEASSDRRRRFVVLQPRQDYAQLLPSEPAIQAVRELVSELVPDQGHGVTVRMTGGVPLAYEELTSVRRGAEWILVFVVLIVGGLLLAGLRSPLVVLATLLTLLAGLSLTAAFAIGVVGHLNLISIAFAILYLGLGVDYAIHLCLRYRELLDQGGERHASIRRAGADVGGPLLLCSLTTSFGFYAFVPTAYSGVSELGLISGTGMLISFAVTLTLLPALLTLIPPPAARRGAARMPRLVAGFLELPVRHRRPVLLGAAALGLTGVVAVPFVRFDANPLNLRDPDSESVRTFRDLLATSSTPPWSLQVLEPDASRVAKRVARLRSLPEVETVVSIDDFVPGGQEEKLEIVDEIALLLGPELGEGRRIASPARSLGEQIEAVGSLRRALDVHLDLRPDAAPAALHDVLAELAARLMPSAEPDAHSTLQRVEHNLLANLPRALTRLNTMLEAESFERGDLPPERLRRWVNPRGTHRIEVFPGENLDQPGAMRRFVDAVRSAAPQATGAPVTILESGNTVVRAFRQAFLWAGIATGAVLLLLLRSLRYFALVLAPILLGGLLLVASTVAFRIPFDFANVIGLPLLLGIGVDSSIHMVHRARAGLPHGANVLRTSTARAVLLSALTTFCSFVSLSLSAHPGTAGMGSILTIGVSWILMSTLVVLPAFLANHPAAAHSRAPAGSTTRA